jgi:hypothetical protein
MIPALLCWAAVVLDCNGGPEPGVTYRDEVAYIVVTGMQPCDQSIPPDPQYGDCPIYGYTLFNEVADDADPCVPGTNSSPGPGEVTLIRTTAIDLAGNEDCGP